MFLSKKVILFLFVLLFLQGCPLIDEEESLVEPPADTEEPIEVEPTTDEQEPANEEPADQDPANKEPVVVVPTTTLDDIDVAAVRAKVKSSMMKLSAAVEQVADTTDAGLENIINEDFAILEEIVSEMSDGDEEASLGGLIGDALERLVATQSADRSHVVYTLAADHIVEICGDDQDCSTLFGNLSLAQYFNADATGTLELRYTLEGVAYVPLIIGYGNSEWYIESKMRDLKDTLVALNTGTNGFDIPLTAEGVVRASISQVDEVTVEAIIDVSNDVNISGKIGTKATDQVLLKIASSKVLKLTSAADTGKLTITADMGTLAGMMYGNSDEVWDPELNDYVIKPKKLEITSAGIVGTIEIDFANKKAMATGLGLKNDGIEFKEDDVVIFAATTSISSYTIQAPEGDDQFVFKAMADTTAEMMIEGAIFGEDKRISASATAGSTVEFHEGVYSMGLTLVPDYAKVTAGTLTGTEFLGVDTSYEVSASVDQCLGEPMEGEILPTAIACPGDVPPSVLTFETFGNGGGNVSLDIQLYGYDEGLLTQIDYGNSDGTYNMRYQYQSNDLGEYFSYPRINYVSIPGTYYLRVSSSYGGIGGYGIRVSDTGPGGSSTMVPVDATGEPNNVSDSAATLELNVTQDHTLTADDVDWFKFTVVE